VPSIALGGGSVAGPRCASRKGQPNRRTRAWLAFQPDATAEVFGDNAVDDVQSKTRRSMMTPCGEERIEGLQLDLRRHSASIVGHNEFDVIVAGRCQIDAHLSSTVARIGVGHRIHHEMGQDLPERTRITVHFKISLEPEIEQDTLAPKFAIEIRQQLF